MGHPVRLALTEPLTNRDSGATKDSKLSNCFMEDVGGHPEVIKRPGTSVAAQLSIGVGQGVFTYNNILYGITNDILVGSPGATLVSDGTVWSDNGVGTNPIPAFDGNFGTMQAVFQGPDGVYVLAGTFLVGSSSLFCYKTTDNKNWTKTLATVDSVTAPAGLVDSSPIYWNGFFWLFGGHNSGSSATTYNCIYKSADCVTWNLVTNSAPMSIGYTSSVCVFNNFIYLITAKQLWKMTTNTGLVWSSVGTTVGTASALFKPILGGFNNAIWVYGGYVDINGTLFQEVWSTTNEGTTWTRATASAGFLGSHWKGQVCNYNNKMWLIDANASGGWRVINSVDGITWSVALSSVSWTQYYYAYIGTPFILNGTMLTLTMGSTVTAPLDPHIWSGVLNAPTGQSYPLTPSTSGLTFDFSLAQSAAGQNGFFFKSTKDAYFFNNTILTKVTSVNYPATTVPGVVYLDGTYYVGTSAGLIYGSAIEDPTTWSALNYVSASVEPDGLVAIVKSLNYLVALGAWSTEFFYDAGNPTGSPLSSVPNAFFNIGCASGSSVVKVDNAVIWMSQTRQRGRQIVMLNGFQPETISSSEVDRILNADSLATVYSFSIRTNGSTFYVLTIKGSNKTLVYDLSTKQWHFWSSMSPQTAHSVTSVVSANGVATVSQTAHGFADGDVVLIAGASPTAYNGFKNITYVDANTYTFPIAVGTSTPATGTITAQGYTEQYFNGVSYTYATGADYIQGELDGKVYAMDPAQGSDSGNYINMLIRTIRTDGGNALRKFIRRAELIGDKVAATAFLRYTDDDYQTYTNYTPMDMSAKRTLALRLGHTRRRAFDIRITDNQPIRISALELDVDPGVS